MASDQVLITTRHTLTCATEATVASLESPFNLGPMDYSVPPKVSIEGVFIYRKPTSTPTNHFLVSDRLMEAVSHLLDYYPHLTGRLQLHPTTHAAQIGSLGCGVDFWQARCTTTLRKIATSSLSGRIITPKLPGYGAALLPIFHATMGSYSHNAILAIQHTRFACGGVCDAQGFFQVVRDLAEIYRQLRDSCPPSLISPPEIRSHFRTHGELSPSAAREALNFKPSCFYLAEEDEDNIEIQTAIPNDAPISARVLRFSSEDLAEFKRAATNPDHTSGTWVSTFEALSAFLFQRVYKAKVQVIEGLGISPDDDRCEDLRQFFTLMDMRDRDRLNLPPRYLANAVHSVSLYPSHADLIEGPLWYIAETIHSAIRSVDPAQVKQEFEWVAAQTDPSRVKLLDDFQHGGLAIIQWTRDHTHLGFDFEVRDSGRPVVPSLVTPPLSGSYLTNGLAMVIATQEKSASGRGMTGTQDEWDLPRAVYINMVLNDEIWSFLERDIDFLKYIC
ncbi:unnamed protein product [Penicillium bialowiezense]